MEKFLPVLKEILSLEPAALEQLKAVQADAANLPEPLKTIASSTELAAVISFLGLVDRLRPIFGL